MSGAADEDEADELLLIEAAAGAHRPRDPIHRTVSAHPAWRDLGADGRVLAFAVAEQLRAMEAALDPEGLSTTARSVLERITGR